MNSSKSDIVTFKVEAALAEMIRHIPNKSEFIRTAILSALQNTCPLCQGTGVLTPRQREHWSQFALHHQLERCDDCDAVHLHCDYTHESHQHPGTRQGDPA